MVPLRDVMKNKDICVIALIIFYENEGTKPEKVYGVLSCVFYSIIDNYVCIKYLLCQSKNLSIMFSNRIFGQTSFNILVGIGIS